MITVDTVARDAAPWVERLARMGFVAKSLLYVTIGVLAASAALGSGGRTNPDQRSAMAALIAAPYGRGLLAVVAVGLAGYALWRIVAGVLDAEHRGRGAKGLAIRGGSIVTGLIHVALAYSAAHLALGHRSGGGGEQQSRHWAARALEWPGGTLVLWGVAAGLVGYGVYQLYRAAVAKLDKQLALGALGRRERSWAIGISRFGIASRGVVFGTIGLLFARAARDHDPSQAGGMADSLRTLVQLGRWPFLGIAVGLIAYGGYELINARYREIEAG